MIIAFHDNAISELGTSVAIYDYAFYLRVTHTVYIIGTKNHPATTETAVSFFKQTFGDNYIFLYNDISEMHKFLIDKKVTHFYAIKCGANDQVLPPPGVMSLIHCTGLIVEPHGDYYFTVSKTLSDLRGKNEPFLDHMINLPDTSENLRSKLNIPEDSIVIGRYGGTYSFDIPFVENVIREVLKNTSNVYFLFINVNILKNIPRVIHLPVIYDRLEKVKFINTCDAMLHARIQGESWGLAVGEFSSKNKRVITWANSVERNHINVLGDKGVYYSTGEDLYNILINFKKDNNNYNAYTEYTPEKIISKFEDILDKQQRLNYLNKNLKICGWDLKY